MAKLSIVATPIGNLEDITLRALRTITECDVIYAEDTRVVSKLLTHYGHRKSLQRLDAATESEKAVEIVERLEAGQHVVYVSDAGTPGVSDPGARLVAHVREEVKRSNLFTKIEAIPGASALTAALSIAGLTSDAFTFYGFLPHKKGRQTLLKKIAESDIPVVLYESPHRILKLLEELVQHQVSHTIIARELTKVHEEVRSGTPSELLEHFATHPDTVRGEFVVILEPKRED